MQEVIERISISSKPEEFANRTAWTVKTSDEQKKQSIEWTTLLYNERKIFSSYSLDKEGIFIIYKSKSNK